MVTMHVADEDSLKLLKAAPIFSQGQLDPFTCINEVPVTVDIQKLRRRTSIRRRNCRTGAKKNHFESHRNRRPSKCYSTNNLLVDCPRWFSTVTKYMPGDNPIREICPSCPMRPSRTRRPSAPRIDQFETSPKP